MEEISYRSLVCDTAGEALRAAAAFCEAGVPLLNLSFTSFQPELRLAADHDELLTITADNLHLAITEKRAGFAASDVTEIAQLRDVLARLAEEGISLTSLHWRADAPDPPRLLLTVRPEEVRKAATVLDVAGSRAQIADDVVDEASDESFPASDPPAANVFTGPPADRAA